ncbi:MAG: hypothetical protein A3J46_03700 [Candidatus Yanofskybacteria bacterium RIFCSPHIGHO2_02_FULL_41_11]|uniref:Glutamyl-tRNA amidotransferase n=1 Tax=Candidatus Yanofskybacteria bacterium RIFCSPHIGHO2_02_FULL_41_11 TaxID=1802675 RepID=A0A1F8F9H6_9BACT|nr:MAG: hypothetical protein A3J46_03700 [Candidatus Yanofskybacteria bacterium RIFCSPHIGHO2_02_FULL_41_11]
MLKEKLTQDLKEALKSGNAKKRLVVGMVLNSVKNRELQKRAKSGKEEALNDEEILEVIASEVKKRKESIESFKAGGREELAQNEKEELDILMTYMPEQMSEDAIREVVRQTIKDMASPAEALAKAGQVIGAVMAKLKGKAEGGLVSKIVKEELSKPA